MPYGALVWLLLCFGLGGSLRAEVVRAEVQVAGTDLARLEAALTQLFSDPVSAQQLANRLAPSTAKANSPSDPNVDVVPTAGIMALIRQYFSDDARVETFLRTLRPRWQAIPAEPPVPEASMDVLRRSSFRVPLPRHAQTRGVKNAPFRIVLAGNFESAFSREAWAVVQRALDEYPKLFNYTFVHLPTWEDPYSVPAAVALLRAADLGTYWPIHDKLFAQDGQLSRLSLAKLHAETRGMASSHPVKLQPDARHQDVIREDIAWARAHNARTPQLLINGKEVDLEGLLDTLGRRGPRFNPEEVSPRRTRSPLAEEFLQFVNEHPGFIRSQFIRFDQRKFAAIMDDTAARLRQAVLHGLAHPAVLPEGDSPARGLASAPVTIVEFSSMQCSASAAARSTIARLETRFPGQLRHVHKFAQVSSHDRASLAARVLLAAQRQGRFWEMRSEMFEHRSEFHRAGFRAMAQRAGVQFSQLESAYAQGIEELDALIAADARLATDLHIEGSPVFFVNGIQIDGALPYPVFERLIEILLGGPVLDPLAAAESIVHRLTADSAA